MLNCIGRSCIVKNECGLLIEVLETQTAGSSMKKTALRTGLIFITILALSLLVLTFVGEPQPAVPVGADAPGSIVTEEDLYTSERDKMVTNTIESRGVVDAEVLEAMRTVPRHLFVPADMRRYAYSDEPLPIGYGQTISQPYIVAWMTELLALKAGEKVLEIGTGSGYQAAVLAELGRVEVYSIEIIPELAERAAATLDQLGYADLHLKQGDGYFGWEEFAPFDAIIVTCAPDHLPQPLVQQLKESGRLVIPIGPVGGFQTLWKFVKEGEDVRAYNLGGVSFVPLTRE
jgi:protein-L-isoaspartate(D-aspartate) O-methyltransferase